MDCMVSVVVPVYNVERYVDKCVDSIVNQTYKNIQIILVDDGSTDSSGTICDAWKDKDPRIEVIHQENGGLAHARNEGMKKIIGDYVLFVDSDDWIDLDMIETLLHGCIENEADIAVCRYRNVYLDHTESNESGVSFVCDGEKALYYHIFEMSRPYSFCYAVWNKLYRYELIKDFRFPKGRQFEDIVFTSQVLYCAKKVYYIDKAKYNYVVEREGSIMNDGFTARKITDELVQMDERICFFNEMRLEKYSKKAIEILINRIYQYYAQLLFSQKICDKKQYFLQLKDLHKKYKKYTKRHFKAEIFTICPKLVGIYYGIRMKLI